MTSIHPFLFYANPKRPPVIGYGTPEIESNRKPAKRSITLWHDTPSHAKHRLTEDTQVTYKGLRTILENRRLYLQNIIISEMIFAGRHVKCLLDTVYSVQGWLMIQI